MLETVGAGLRPLGTTAIVDAAIEHVREDPVLYYGIAAPVSFPLAAAALWFFDLVRDYHGAPEGFAPRVAVAAIVLSALFHLRFVAQGALAWALERRLRGLEATVAGAWWAALRSSLSLIFCGAVLWALAACASLFFVVPALLPFALLCLAPPVAIAEDATPFRTFARAISLGWLEIGRSTAIVVILGLGAVALAFGLALGVSALLDLARTVFYTDFTYLGAVLTLKNPTFVVGAIFFGLAMLEPVKAISYTLLYVDRRVRAEGFDLKRKVQLILERDAQEAEAAR